MISECMTKCMHCIACRLRVLCFHNAGSAEDMFTSEGTGARKTASPLLVRPFVSQYRDVLLIAPCMTLLEKTPFRAATLVEPTGSTSLQVTQTEKAMLLSLIAPQLLKHANISIIGQLTQ